MIIAMIDEEHVNQVIAEAEGSLKECWATLSLLHKGGASITNGASAIKAFQANLFTCLFQLESFYNKVCKCQRELISKRKSVEPSVFSEERQKLEKYKDAIDEVIDIGKSLGDAFAWMFYQRSRPL